MNLYLIEQDAHDDYDTFDSAVVAAETEDEARDMNPGGGEKIDWSKPDHYFSWCYAREQVKVTLIGVAVPFTKSGPIVASFNAG